MDDLFSVHKTNLMICSQAELIQFLSLTQRCALNGCCEGALNGSVKEDF